MSTKVNVIGVGMVEFGKPGKSDPYEVMVGNATKEALTDAGVGYDETELAALVDGGVIPAAAD